MKTKLFSKLFSLVLVFSFMSNYAQVKDKPTKENSLPKELSEFKGKIGKTYKTSEEYWQNPPSPPEGAPNVIIILLDDVGFGQTSTYGGSIPTPNLDKLADNGLMYNRFHTTAVCAPTRAALLTGRNHHEAGSGFLVEWATGFPSYNCLIPKSTATIGEILKGNGYPTAWFGKNHNTPDWETSIAGPYDRWPTGLGFDYFYGFNAGEAHQYYPAIYENTIPVEPDKSPEEGYHFMTDMTDKAISWMQQQKSIAPDKPIFMYFAPGAVHAPHHVTKKWRDQFIGKFDHGWDKERDIVFARQKAQGIIPQNSKLPPRHEEIPSWDSRSADEKKLYTRLIENFAGYMAFTDYEVGRLTDAISELPDADNTIIIYIVGDNGASSEGGMEGTINEVKGLSGISSSIEENLEKIDEIGDPSTEPHYPVGWAWAGNTPFKWVKQVASHFGGSRNPMVITWPKVIKEKRVVRDQFLHVVDVMPTILEATGISMPSYVKGIAQKPVEGKSFVSTFTNKNAPEIRHTQYFEVLSNRAIYHDGWIAAHQHTLPWRQDIAPGYENEVWELYNLKEDFTEANDLSKKNPAKLKEMLALFDSEAERNHVYPLDDRGSERLVSPKPSPVGDRTSFVFHEGAVRIPETAAPNLKNRSFTIEATVTGKDAEGVLLASGGGSAGLSFYVKDGKPMFTYNWFDTELTDIISSKTISGEKSVIRFEFDYHGGKEVGKGATGKIFLNDELVAEKEIPKTVAGRFGVDTFGVGADTGSPVTHHYKPPFTYTGHIEEVKVDLK